MKPLLLSLSLLLFTSWATAQVPQLINYQGRVAVGTVNFEGTGQFRFALVNAAGSTVYWGNAADTTPADGVPDAAVSLTVTKGLYSVLLGDTSITSMAAIPASVWTNADVRLRVWFDDGVNGNQLLTPDQRLAPNGYHADGSVGSSAIADGAVSATKIATGSVTNTQLAADAVQAGNIAAGAVGSAQIAGGAVNNAKMAAGAITAANLATQSRSGTMLDGVLNFSTPGSVSVPIVLIPALAVTPTISQTPGGWMFSAVTPSGFTASIPFAPVAVASTGNVGQNTTVVQTASGLPAICYHDITRSKVVYAIAPNADGSGSWTSVDVDAANTGTGFSLAILGGVPCISYRPASGGLAFARSSTADGTGAWTVTVVDPTAGNYSSLALVAGRPAISYRNISSTSLKYAIAPTADGSGTWSVATVDSSTGNTGNHTSLCVVNGHPAISYQDVTNGRLKYVRATDATGSAWGASVTLDPEGFSDFQTSLRVVNGNPAISYYYSFTNDLRYIRATDSDGAAWGAPVSVDSAGNVGQHAALAIVNGRPAISCYDTTNGDLKLAYASTADGSGTWTAVTIEGTGNVGQYTSLAMINGGVAISYYDVTNQDLKYAVIPALNWTASEFGTAGAIAATSFSGNGSALTNLHGGSIIPGSVGTSQLAVGAVGTAQLAAGSVGTTQLAAGAVGTSKLAAGAVGSAQLASGAVGGAQLAPGAVGTAQLAAGAVGSTQLAAGAVGSAQLAPGAVGSAQLAAGASARPLSTTGTLVTAMANTSYVATDIASPTRLFLPSVANFGDTLQITGAGTGGWEAVSLSDWTPRADVQQWSGVASSADGVKLVAVVRNGAIYTSDDSGVTWTARTGAGVRNWWGVASSADGQKLLATVQGGSLYISTDGGLTWTAEKTDTPRQWRGAAASADGVIMAAVEQTTGKIWTSWNSGTNWNQTPAPNGLNWLAIASSADGQKLVAVVENGQIHTSTDAGEAWTARETSRPWKAVASSADGAKLVAVTYGGRIHTSSDSGATWVPRASNRDWIAVASSDDGSRLVAAVEGGRINTSTDSGASWFAWPEIGNWAGVASSADGTKLVATDENGQIHTTSAAAVTAGGQGANATLQFLGNGRWAPVAQSHLAPGAVAPPVPITGTSQNVQANTNYVTTGNSITNIVLPTTSNVGDVIQINAVGAGGWSARVYDPSTWTQRAIPASWSCVASSADGSKLVAVDNYGSGSGGQIYTSPDSGVTWTPRESGRRWVSVASSADGVKLVAADGSLEAGGRLYTSTDSGVTWTPRDSNRAWTSVASSADGTKLVAVASANASFTEAERIYTSTDSGVTWTPRDSPRGWNCVTSSSDGAKLVATVGYPTFGQIYTSTDSGVTWTPRESVRQWRAVASSADGTKLIAAAIYGRLYTSTDSGVTWTARESDRPWNAVASSADGTRLVAVDVAGDGTGGTLGGQIYTSADSGLTWTAQAGKRRWKSVASSADGINLVAVDGGAFSDGYVYTSGGVSGSQGTATALQYVGGGLWSPLSLSKSVISGLNISELGQGVVHAENIAPQAVGHDQLGVASVGSINIGDWAVNSDKIAPYAVGNFQLADGSVSADKLAPDVGAWSALNGDVYRASGDVGIGTNVPFSKLHVVGDRSGPRNFYANYPLFVEGSNQGIAIDVNGANADGSPNHTNAYLLMTSSGTERGSIQGQDMADLQESFDYQWFYGMYYAQLAWQSAQIAAQLAQLDLGEVAVSTVELGVFIGEWANQAIHLEQSVGVVFQSGSGDYAEWLEKKNPAEDIKAAEIIGMSGGKISKDTASSERCMIVSTAPIVAGNMQSKDDEKRFKKVAFIGQVPVKVRGAVRVGDYVVASGLNDGYGIGISPERMSLQDYPRIAGVAWSALAEGQGEGLVKVAVGINTNDLTSKLIQQQKQIDSIVSYLKAKDPAFPSLKNVAANPAPQSQDAPVVAAQARPRPAAGAAPDWAKLKQSIKDHPELFEKALSTAKEQLAAKGIDLGKHPRVARALDIKYYTDWAKSKATSLEPPRPPGSAQPAAPATMVK